jgi:hypothetical protein
MLHWLLQILEKPHSVPAVLRESLDDPEGTDLLWACLAAAGSGLAIGLRFRVPLLLAAAAILSFATLAVAVYEGWSVTRTLGVLFLLLAFQQGFYLLGLFASLRR